MDAIFLDRSDLSLVTQYTKGAFMFTRNGLKLRFLFLEFRYSKFKVTYFSRYLLSSLFDFLEGSCLGLEGVLEFRSFVQVPAIGRSLESRKFRLLLGGFGSSFLPTCLVVPSDTIVTTSGSSKSSELLSVSVALEAPRVMRRGAFSTTSP
jgi:hypothetical protein